MKSPFIVFLIILISSTETFGQAKQSDVICSTGDSYMDPAFSVDWTIGESYMEVFGYKSTMLSQGFQQPGRMLSNTDEKTGISGKVLCYPNPATNSLIIDFNSFDETACLIEMYDLKGKLLFRERVINIPIEFTYKIALESYGPGLYLIKLTVKNEHIVNLISKINP